MEQTKTQVQSDFDGFWHHFLTGPRVTPPISFKQFKVVDLFSSVGGLTLGASIELAQRKVAIKPMAAVDVDRDALDVYRSNWRTATAVNRSIREIVDVKYRQRGDGWQFAYDPELLEPSLQDQVGKIDLVVAGPPCQGNSNLNNVSRLKDPRNKLYLDAAAVAVALKAPRIVIENVPGVVWAKDNVVGATAELLQSKGYQLEMGVLAADQFGWPQTRKRFFMVASLEQSPIPFADIRGAFSRPPLPVTWAIEGVGVSGDDLDLFRAPANLTEISVKRIKELDEAGLFDMPLSLRPASHQEGTSYTASYGRMRPDKPAPTLTTGFFTPGRGRFIHPLERRTLTAHEAARIQGFPDWYDFTSGKHTRTSLAKWIGDAVPPILGYLATKSVMGI